MDWVHLNRWIQEGRPMNQNHSNPSDEKIREILDGMKRVAVVGISAKPDRASHGIARFLVGQGFDVVGVNPVLKEDVLGIKVYSSLTDVPGSIDVVDVFRRSETVPPVVDEAIAVKAKVVWMQLGIVNEDAAKCATNAGLEVVMDKCIKIEYNEIKS